MRERMERFVLLPFTIGCVSESSIAVGAQKHRRRSKSDTNPSPIRTKEEEEDDDDDDEEERDSLSSGENMKNSFRSLALSKPNISIGIHRLFKGFKTVSQRFVYKDEMAEEEEEMDMEIGCPTDVKHVTHIGLDTPASASVTAASASAATTDQINKASRDDIISPATWRQFELSRDSQPDAHDVNVKSVASIPLHEYLSRVNYGMRD